MLSRLIQGHRLSSPSVASAVLTICLACPTAAFTLNPRPCLAPGQSSRHPDCGLTTPDEGRSSAARSSRSSRGPRAMLMCASSPAAATRQPVNLVADLRVQFVARRRRLHVDGDHAKPLREGTDILVEEPRGDRGAVQENERIDLPALVIRDASTCHIGISRHARMIEARLTSNCWLVVARLHPSLGFGQARMTEGQAGSNSTVLL
jgi:hypothetical protein